MGAGADLPPGMRMAHDRRAALPDAPEAAAVRVLWGGADMTCTYCGGPIKGRPICPPGVPFAVLEPLCSRPCLWYWQAVRGYPR